MATQLLYEALRPEKSCVIYSCTTVCIIISIMMLSQYELPSLSTFTSSAETDSISIDEIIINNTTSLPPTLTPSHSPTAKNSISTTKPTTTPSRSPSLMSHHPSSLSPTAKDSIPSTKSTVTLSRSPPSLISHPTRSPTVPSIDNPPNRVYMIWNNNSYIHNMSHNQYCDLMYQSYLYTPNCTWSGDISHEWSLLVTATPRSGTVFTKLVLNKLGIHVVDDWHSPKINISDGIISWIDAFYDEKEDHIGPSRLHNTRFKYVLHQIREPLKSITSMCTEPLLKGARHEMGPQNRRFINRHIGDLLDKERVDDGPGNVVDIMQFYYNWHMQLNLFGFPIFKVENFFMDNATDETPLDTLNWIIETSELQDKVDKEFLCDNDDKIELCMSDKLYKILHIHPNSRPHRNTFTWDELFVLNEELAMKIWNMSQKYGYHYDWDYQSWKQNITKPSRESISCIITG